MKIAVIDLGTNTFHLVILELPNDNYLEKRTKRLEEIEIARKRIYINLGEGSLASSYITPEAQQRAIDAMMEFRQMLDTHSVEEVHAVATSAMRNASNGSELADKIEKQTNIPIRIISGAQEASLIYRGVKEAVKLNEETALIMDIGGGSVEFIICDTNESLWAHSFEIGAQRLVDNFHQQDPILVDDLMRMDSYLEQNLQPLFKAVHKYNPTKLVGSSGAFTTLMSMHAAKEKITLDKLANCYNLPFEKLEQLYKDIRYTTHEERLQVPGLSNQRVDMIVVSAALIYFILNKTGIREIIASKYSLKVGLFFHALEKLQEKIT
jgi:exopolyphosphatase/guanosine-5'-triphosphate,3'-diphosphate pyrophosphatase